MQAGLYNSFSATMEENTKDFIDILETYWEEFLEVLPRLGMAILVIIIGLFIASWLSRLLRRKLQTGMQDPLMGRFIANMLKAALVILVLMLALQAAGLSGIAGGLLAATGVTTLVLGFAFKDIGENFLAGIILAFNRPFRLDDAIKVGDIFGKVKSLDFRYTHIKTFDGRDVFLPNGNLLQEPVENYTRDGFFRMEFIVGIDYDDDIAGATSTIMEAIREVKDVKQEPPHEPFVVTDELAASTVNLRVFFWVDTDDYRKGALETKGLVIRLVKQRLLAEGYSLPSDITEVKFYGGSPFPIGPPKNDK